MYKSLAFAAGVLIASLGVAAAQTVGLATTKGGATSQVSTALAKTITESSDLQVRPQVLANTSQYIPLVNDGRIEFGIANFPQTAFAIRGTGMSKGQPNPEIVAVASLIPFNAGLLVTEASGIETLSDLEGKKVPRFPADSLGDFVIRTSLEAGGLTYDDVVSVPMSNFPSMYQAIKDGTTDVTIAVPGSQPTFDIEATAGAVKFITYSEAEGEVMAGVLPGLRLKPWEGMPEVPGMDEDTVIFTYDYILFANKGVAGDIVKKVAAALYESTDTLKASSPIWNEYDPEKLASATELPYHPAAIEFYEEKGIWQGE